MHRPLIYSARVQFGAHSCVCLADEPSALLWFFISLTRRRLFWLCVSWRRRLKVRLCLSWWCWFKQNCWGAVSMPDDAVRSICVFLPLIYAKNRENMQSWSVWSWQDQNKTAWTLKHNFKIKAFLSEDQTLCRIDVALFIYFPLPARKTFSSLDGNNEALHSWFLSFNVKFTRLQTFTTRAPAKINLCWAAYRRKKKKDVWVSRLFHINVLFVCLFSWLWDI